MVTGGIKGKPVVASEQERATLTELERLFANGEAHGSTLLGPGGEHIRLPESALRALREALFALANDQAIMVVSFQKLLTTQQAADLLDVPHAYLVRLVDEGVIASDGTGLQRQVLLDDLMTYMEQRDAQRRRALDSLAQMSQEIEPLLK